MGTILYPGGAAFRVWAPFAPAVFATGTFNQWSTTAHPFAPEGNGYWSVEVPGARVGDEYRFFIPVGSGLRRKNPYASEVVNSSGNAVITRRGRSRTASRRRCASSRSRRRTRKTRRSTREGLGEVDQGQKAQG